MQYDDIAVPFLFMVWAVMIHVIAITEVWYRRIQHEYIDMFHTKTAISFSVASEYAFATLCIFGELLFTVHIFFVALNRLVILVS